MSLITTLVAFEGPLLVTSIVNVTTSPISVSLSSTVLTMSKLTIAITSNSKVSLLLV